MTKKSSDRIVSIGLAYVKKLKALAVRLTHIKQEPVSKEDAARQAIDYYEKKFDDANI